MFDDMLGSQGHFGRNTRVPVDLPLDKDGYLDRVCQDLQCGASFKVMYADLGGKFREGVMTCPTCGLRAPTSNWNTPAQWASIKQQALAHAQRTFGAAIQRELERFNRALSRPRIVSVSLHFEPGARVLVLPIAAAASMEQRTTCGACGCRFATIGLSFFCPACGASLTIPNFVPTMDAVAATVGALEKVSESVSETTGKDTAADAVRLVVEGCLSKVVASFQCYAEALYAGLPSDRRRDPRRNVFQNLDEGSELWNAGLGCGYGDVLSAEEVVLVRRLFQQRHLLAHRDGIVDEKYLRETGDAAYRAGQRVVVQPGDVLLLVASMKKLAAALCQRAQAG
jgi:hypothetical protein